MPRFTREEVAEALWDLAAKALVVLAVAGFAFLLYLLMLFGFIIEATL